MVTTRNNDYTSMERAPKRKRSVQARAKAQDPSIPPKDGSCWFLNKLPGELRSRIYDLSLWVPEGLFYRLEDGKPRLCMLAWGSSATKGRGKKNQKVAAWLEANQLQYVSRQFRIETKGFGVRLNSLHFVTLVSPYNHPSSLDMCSTFFNNLHPGHFQHLRTITIRQADKFNRNRASYKQEYFGFGGIQAQILDVCRLNPKMTVEWACPNWELQERFCNFIFRGVVLSLAYRTSSKPNEDTEEGSFSEPAASVNIPLIQHSNITNPVINTSKVSAEYLTTLFPLKYNATDSYKEYQSDAEFWRQGVGETKIFHVPNFKIFPFNVTSSREVYEKDVEKAAKACGPHKPATVSIEAWKALALDWYNDGI